jgi:hypothetical protein
MRCAGLRVGRNAALYVMSQLSGDLVALQPATCFR